MVQNHALIHCSFMSYLSIISYAMCVQTANTYTILLVRSLARAKASRLKECDMCWLHTAPACRAPVP